MNEMHRRTVRLREYDYSGPGAYFVTICTQGGECRFGEIADGKVMLNDYGLIAEEEWVRTPTLRPNVTLDEYVIMPDHVHGIIVITTPGPCRGVLQYAPTDTDMSSPTTLGVPSSRTAFRSPSQTVGAIIRGFKSTVAGRINKLRATPGAPFWQRNFHERIIRKNDELNRVRRYIRRNPGSIATCSDKETERQPKS